MSSFRDLTGQRFGRLIVLSREGLTLSKSVLWLCQCDCGMLKKIPSSGLLRKIRPTQSCGCLQKEQVSARRKNAITHGKTKTRVYHIWSAMHQRCSNPKMRHYAYYGGRGITVCERWHDFEAFYEDMGDPPLGFSLDRYPDQDGNYCLENCRWASRKQQSNNTRRNIIVPFQGENFSLKEMAEKLGVPYNTVFSRVSRGWTIERALTTIGDARYMKKAL